MSIVIGAVPIQDASGNQDKIGVFAIVVNGVTYYSQLCSVGDALTGNPVSVPVIGSRGANALVIQGDPSAVPVPVTQYSQGSTTAVVTPVTVTSLVDVVLNPNANRLACMMYNQGPATIYIAFGSTVSASSYSFQLAPGEMQFIDQIPWRGAYAAVSAAADAQLFITEFTP